MASENEQIGTGGLNRAALLFSLLIGIIGSYLSFELWCYLEEREDWQVTHGVALAMEAKAPQLKMTLDDAYQGMRRMADRWAATGGTPKAEWEADARRIRKDSEFFHSISWIDTDGILRWTVPLEGNEGNIDKDMKLDGTIFHALLKSQTRLYAHSSPVVPLYEGGSGVLTFFPIHQGEERLGYILGTFDVKKLLSYALGTNHADIAFRVEEDGKEIFRSTRQDDRSVDQTKQREYHLKHHGLNWMLLAAPTHTFVKKSHSEIPLFTLLTGLTITLLVSVLVYLLSVLRTREK